MVFFLLGYLLKENNYPIGPIVLGIILRPMIDSNFRRAALSAGGLKGIAIEIASSPVSIVLVMAIIYLMISGRRVSIQNKSDKSE